MVYFLLVCGFCVKKIKSSIVVLVERINERERGKRSETRVTRFHINIHMYTCFALYYQILSTIVIVF